MSHQIGEEVLPFREIFAVLFFVSVGMLVNPALVLANIWQVLALTALIIGGKALLTLLAGLLLPSSGRTILVVAAGLGQIGEFSFIVGQAGVALGVLTSEQYALILAGALISITLNPLLFRLLPATERALQRIPFLWRRLERHQSQLPLPADEGLSGHVVLCGYGRVGEHVVKVLTYLNIPCLVVEQDARRAAAFADQGLPTLQGDAANSEVLTHAGLERAQALVITVPDEVATELIVAAARTLAPDLPIIARAATREGVTRLTERGAQDVIHPELEGGLEVVRHTLLALGYPGTQVSRYTDAVRRDQYDATLSTPDEHDRLARLLASVGEREIDWYEVAPNSAVVGRTLAESNLRARTGASVVAILRDGEVIANPKSTLPFAKGDWVGVIGEGEQRRALRQILTQAAQPAGEWTLPTQEVRHDGAT